MKGVCEMLAEIATVSDIPSVDAGIPSRSRDVMPVGKPVPASINAQTASANSNSP
jgi:hypothetical protein